MVTECWAWENSVGHSGMLCIDGQWVIITSSPDYKQRIRTKTTPAMAHILFKHWSESSEPQNHIGVFNHDETQ